MELGYYWNEAIKQCFFNDNEVVFIPFYVEIIEKVGKLYLEECEEPLEFEEMVKLNGGYVRSYYTALKSVYLHPQKKQYPFLRFSFFPLVAFQLDARSGFWNKYQLILEEKVAVSYNYINATSIYEGSVSYLKAICKATGKKFLDINIYGTEAKWKYVGRIYSHAVFQSADVVEIKRSICRLNFLNMPIDELDIEAINSILLAGDLERAHHLFLEIPELIEQTIKSLLSGWAPSENEIIDLLSTSANKSAPLSTGLPLRPIWKLNYIPNQTSYFSIKLGFLWKRYLGSEGRIILNENDNIYIDLDHSPPKPATWDKFIYLLNTVDIPYDTKLWNGKWNLNFRPAAVSSIRHEPFALKSISSNYYVEMKEKRILYSTEILVHVTPERLEEQFNALLTPIKNIQLYDAGEFLNFYKVNGPGIIEGIEYIKVNNEVDITIDGVGDGTSGVRSYLASFPIRINGFNSTYGRIELFDSDNQEVVKIAYSGHALVGESMLINKPGNYLLKIKNDLNEYVVLKNGNDHISFQIVESGKKDRRVNILSSNVYGFEFEYLPEPVDLSFFVDNWIIPSYNHWQVDFLPHFLFDFVFSDGINRVSLNRNQFFLLAAQELDGINCEKVHHYPGHGFTREYKYLSGKFVAKACSNAEITIRLNKEWYNYELFPERKVTLEVFKFELIEMDQLLQQNFPNCRREILFITNCRTSSKPELLMEKYCQKSFPFKIFGPDEAV